MSFRSLELKVPLSYCSQRMRWSFNGRERVRKRGNFFRIKVQFQNSVRSLFHFYYTLALQTGWGPIMTGVGVVRAIKEAGPSTRALT